MSRPRLPADVRIGVCILPETRWRDAAPQWRDAEELGFDHAWTYDHLAWRTLRDDPWFAAVPTLAAAASVTSRLRLGTLVASPNFRHPVPFARELLTLDDLSDGRLEIGIGAGGTGWDAEMLGQRPWSGRERSDRFVEFVELLERLLREPAVDHSGEHYAAVGARSAPGPVQRPRPPLAIAATGPRGMRLAARHAATWVTTGPRRPGDDDELVAALADQVRGLEAACDVEGRDPDSIARLVLTGPELEPHDHSVGAFAEQVHRLRDAGFTDVVVHRPRPSAPYRGDLDRFREVLGSLLGDRGT